MSNPLEETWFIRECGCCIGVVGEENIECPQTEFGRARSVRLVSASPELYRALETLCEIADAIGFDCSNEVIDMAKAALAKARGE